LSSGIDSDWGSFSRYHSSLDAPQVIKSDMNELFITSSLEASSLSQLQSGYPPTGMEGNNFVSNLSTASDGVEVAVGIVPPYDAVVVQRNAGVVLFDSGVEDGDRVEVSFNGQVINPDLTLTNSGTGFGLTLTPGTNRLQIRALNEGSLFPNTTGIRLAGQVIYGDSDFSIDALTGDTNTITLGLPTIRIDGSRYPESARHVLDAYPSPVILTIDRPGADARRTASIANFVANGGTFDSATQDRDEVPPAVFLENGGEADVRPISLGDNRAAGSNLGQQLNNYGPNNIMLMDRWNVDFWATPPVPVPV
jgi:hypothetical protein